LLKLRWGYSWWGHARLTPNAKKVEDTFPTHKNASLDQKESQKVMMMRVGFEPTRFPTAELFV
jgi:hypothetical protein